MGAPCTSRTRISAPSPPFRWMAPARPSRPRSARSPRGRRLRPTARICSSPARSSDHVAMLDARTLKLIKLIPIEGRPRGAQMAADGSVVYVSIEGGGKLAVIDAATGALRPLIDVTGGDKALKPMGIVEAAGGDLFVTTGRARRGRRGRSEGGNRQAPDRRDRRAAVGDRPHRRHARDRQRAIGRRLVHRSRVGQDRPQGPRRRRAVGHRRPHRP